MNHCLAESSTDSDQGDSHQKDTQKLAKDTKMKYNKKCKNKLYENCCTAVPLKDGCDKNQNCMNKTQKNHEISKLVTENSNKFNSKYEESRKKTKLSE